MDDALKNALWGVLNNNLLIAYPAAPQPSSNPHLPYVRLWDEFFHRATDTVPYRDVDARAQIRDWYFSSAQWWEIYDLLQFAADFKSDEVASGSTRRLGGNLRVPGVAKSPREIFTSRVNAILERELSGYRFVGGVLSPLATKAEAAALEAALRASRSGAFSAAHDHLQVALRLFSNRQGPSYRNVIKEAILAVEAATQVVAGKPGATLGDALKRIDDSIGVHSALSQGFQKIYGYTNDAGGIRHAWSGDGPVSQEDAQFMLASCSAFVGYLIAKAQRAGIVQSP